MRFSLSSLSDQATAAPRSRVATAIAEHSRLRRKGPVKPGYDWPTWPHATGMTRYVLEPSTVSGHCRLFTDLSLGHRQEGPETRV